MLDTQKIHRSVLEALRARGISDDDIAAMTSEQAISEFAEHSGIGRLGNIIIERYKDLQRLELALPELQFNNKNVYSVQLGASQRDLIDSELSGMSIYFSDAQKGACYIEVGEAQDDECQYTMVTDVLNKAIACNINWDKVDILNVY